MSKQPKNPFHPGEMLLEEFLQPTSLSQAAFARQLGWTKARLNELIKGKRGITAESALDLADALGTSPMLWMNLQATFDLDRPRAARNAALALNIKRADPHGFKASHQRLSKQKRKPKNKKRPDRGVLLSRL